VAVVEGTSTVDRTGMGGKIDVMALASASLVATSVMTTEFGVSKNSQ